MKFVGKKILVRYENGQEVSADYKSDKEMTWESVNGPAIGTQGTETISAAEVAPDVFFINWVEKEGGITISNVVDFANLRVTAFITFDAPQGRQSLFHRGTFSELPPAAA